MIISNTIKIRWNGFTKTWYEDKGYIYTNIGDEFEARVEDLMDGSGIKVKVQCDNSNCKKIAETKWQDYKKCVHENGKYYCQKCATNLFGKVKANQTRLLKSKSFYDWCIENNRKDVLDRWDYELNDKKPSEVGYSSDKKYWFTCLEHLVHKSELKKLNDFTSGHEHTMDCKQCNSFVQWGINNICEDFLEKYWDYEKNVEIDPWKISYASSKKVWIKCQEKDYHNSYNISCSDFHNRIRCSYCGNGNSKVHPLDSVGQLLKDKKLLNIWSDKNKKSPYEYSINSGQKVWWKCLDNKHEDYYRNISNSNTYDFRCPLCSFSKGEKKIEEYLKINNINYIPQKEFIKLKGLGGGLLSYDFYLEKQNLLIEYQGEFHDGSVPNQIQKDLKKQQKHDKLKKEYAENHNINLLEIWYWDFDNIEKILDKELKIVKESDKY